MNAFANYGEAAVPARRQPKADKPQSALEKKMAERQRLSKAYRAWLRQERATTLVAEPRLRDFLRYLRSVTINDGDELLDAIRQSWLPRSAQHIRIFALRLVARHSDRLVRRAGGEPLDDPLPPETSVYFKARAILHRDGRA